MHRILLIEDDESIARLEKDYLEVSGYETVHESQGDIDKIRRLMDGVSLIILDLMLPKTDGFHILKTLRKEYNLPVIIVSAKDQDMDKVLGLGFGANDYMTKPFSPTELIARVQSHIRNYEALTSVQNPQEEKIIIGDLLINVSTMDVYVGDRPVEMTNKEFSILALLANNRGRVFSKEEIYDRVWHQDAMGYYDTVAVHIRRIREKLEPNAKEPQYIKTLWGVGYKIQ